MNANRLWAKSWDSAALTSPPRSAHFGEHLKDVLESSDRVLIATGDHQLTALGLQVEAYRKRFRRIVRLAAAVHDLGKANDHFQDMVRGLRDVANMPQGLRHEWVTVFMLRGLRGWLLPILDGNELDFAIAEWAIAGHHPGFHHSSPPESVPASGTEMKLFVSHPDFEAALKWLQNALGCDLGAPPIPCVDERLTLIGEGNVFATLKRWSIDAAKRWEWLQGQPEFRLVAAVKNCLIAADIAGSALPKHVHDDEKIWNWIDEAFDSRPEPGDLESIAQHRLNGSSPREFQSAVADSKARVTYVKAGCGSGKTVAAYMWAAQNHPTRRLYFCYPTTGTATEGFRDYLYSPEFDIGAKLFHSRREVDYEMILTGRDQPNSEGEAAMRIDAIEAWSTPVVACTADTVLGLMQNNRRGLLSWPAISQAAIVFDEIHAFDDRMFGSLLRFLRDLPGIPVLLMTASLPKAREEALWNVLGGASLHGLGQVRAPISGPSELEGRPRYHQIRGVANEPIDLVREAYNDGAKVLWVCNTVKRVMHAADLAVTHGLDPLLYHSRFRYIDRVQRHKAVIDAFRESGPALAICSQVAEMSLDLSADLLLTDLAPVPALIQRLGRLNRRAEEGDPTRPFLVIELDCELPYTSLDLKAAKTWLDRLPADNCSQRDLADCWEQDDAPPLMPGPSKWLDGGPKTEVAELRDGSKGITVIREEDCDLIHKSSDVGRYAIPMLLPRGMNWKAWPRPRGFPVAPRGSMNYCAMRGAVWVNQ